MQHAVKCIDYIEKGCFLKSDELAEKLLKYSAEMFTNIFTKNL